MSVRSDPVAARPCLSEHTGCVPSVPSVLCRLKEGHHLVRMKTSGSNPGHGVFLLHMHGLGVKGASLVYILVVPTAVDNLFIYAKKRSKSPAPLSPNLRCD